MPRRYSKGFMRKAPRGKSLTDVRNRFFSKYDLNGDSGRVFRSGGKIRKEVWLMGRGWVSEDAFKRYLGAGESNRVGWLITHYKNRPKKFSPGE